MIPIAFAMALSGAELVAESCPAHSQTSYQVILDVQPLQMAATMSAQEIRDLASSSQIIHPHPPYGFYVSTFGYSIDVTDLSKIGELCPHSIKINIRMILTKRRIEIARESIARRCFYTAYKNHYLNHAAADVVAIEHYLERLQKYLDAFGPNLSASQQNSVEQSVKKRMLISFIDSHLASLDEERKAASVQVDDQDEVERLKKACDKRL